MKSPPESWSRFTCPSYHGCFDTLDSAALSPSIQIDSALKTRTAASNERATPRGFMEPDTTAHPEMLQGRRMRDATDSAFPRCRRGLPLGAMSDLAARIPEDIKTAMKAKDAVALNVLRALKTAMTNASIEKGHLTAPLDDAEVTALIRKQIKQRQDSFEQFSNAGREELAASEKAE